MKYLILFLLFGVCWSNSSEVRAQQNTVEQYNLNFARLKPQSEDVKLVKHLENETEWSSGYESENKLSLVEGSNIRNRAAASINVKRFTVTFAGEVVTPTKTDPDSIFGSFNIQANRSFQQFSLSVKNKLYFKHRKRFGLFETILSKSFHPTDGASIKPFISTAAIYALENSNNNVSNGFFTRTGLEFESKLGKSYIEMKPQFILDRNALNKGSRAAMNIEIRLLFPCSRALLGPKIEYTNFFFADKTSQLEKRQSVIGGFVIKIK